MTELQLARIRGNMHCLQAEALVCNSRDLKFQIAEPSEAFEPSGWDVSRAVILPHRPQHRAHLSVLLFTRWETWR